MRFFFGVEVVFYRILYFKELKTLIRRQIFEICVYCPQSVLIAIFIPLLQASPQHWGGPAVPPGHRQLICRVILGPGTFNNRDLINFSIVKDKYTQEPHGRSLEAGPLHIFLNGKSSGGNDFCPTCGCVRQEGQAQPGHCGGSSWPEPGWAAHW